MTPTYSRPYYFASSPHSGSHDRSSASHSASTSASTSGKRAQSERGGSISSLGSSSGDEAVESEREDDDRDEQEGIMSFAGSSPPLTSPFKLQSGSARSRTDIEHPPRVKDLFADLPLRSPSAIPSQPPPFIPQQRRRVCAEPNCCQKGLRTEGKSAREEGDQHQVSKSFQELFWRRQMWLMEHRDADGESHCSEESCEELDGAASTVAEGAGERGDDSTGVGNSSRMSARRLGKRKTRKDHQDVLRTAGAGLPLARVKRAMKNADEEIKMISHESPALLSRLCTVLIADVSVRAARNALQNGRRTITSNDLRDVTVGQGEGAGDEWEFLRDCVEGQGAMK